MRKKILVILDTNIYGWHTAYATKGERRQIATHCFILISRVQQTTGRVEVFATETIEREIKDAKSPPLSELFRSLIKGVIKKSRRVTKLANEYFTSCKNHRLHVTIEDCEIVAAATIAGVKVLVTENRKTLNNPKVVETINKVNVSRGLRSPKILDAKNASGEIFA